MTEKFGTMARRSRRGGVLPLAVITLVLLLFLGAAVLEVGVQSVKFESSRYWQTRARWNAHGACEWAIWQLATRDHGTDWYDEYGDRVWTGGADYSSLDEWLAGGGGSRPPIFATGWEEDHTRDVNFTGNEDDDCRVRIEEPEWDPTHRVVTAECEYWGRTGTVREVIDLMALALGLDYAMASNSTLGVQGSVLVADPLAAINANIHSNTAVDFSGQPTIKGFVTTSGEFTGLDTRVDPVNDEGDMAKVQEHVNPVPIAEVQPWEFINQLDADDQVIFGNVSLSGASTPISLGTRENPKTIFVVGDVSLSGQIDGYGTIIATGAIKITGNTSYTNPDTPFGSKVALIAGTTVFVKGNTSIVGTIYTPGSFVLGGNATITGSVVAANLDVSRAHGNFTLRYVPANSDLITAAADLKRICYQTRQPGEVWDINWGT